MIPTLSNQDTLFNRLINKLSTYSIPKLVLLAILADSLITCLFSFVLFPGHTAGPKVLANTEWFIITVLAAPLLETWIFQSWIIKSTLKYTNNNKLLAILVSSVAFGLAHYYSIPYIIKATLGGVTYGVLYFSVSGKKKNPYFFIVIAHSTYNLIGFILTYLGTE